MGNGRRRYIVILYWALVLIGLYIISRYNYLLFHGLAEIFSIVVACGIFMVAWNSRHHTDNNYLLFIGIAYLFIGGLDLIHTLSYKGMGVFAGYGANLPTQLWIAARYMEALSLLLAPLFINRKLRLNLIILGYMLIFSFAMGAIFYWNIFPTCFVEGAGLTLFKKISEYIISLVYLGAMPLMFRRRDKFDTGILQLLMASIAISIFSELAFTLYVSTYGLSNVLGHFLKVISFALIYQAIIKTGLENPYKILFKDLKKSEERYRTLVENANEVILVVQDNEIKFVNPKATEIAGYTANELISRSPMDFIHPGDREKAIKHFQRVLAGEEVSGTHSLEIEEKAGNPKWVEAAITLFDWDGRSAILIIANDVTEQKQADEALRESERRYRELS